MSFTYIFNIFCVKKMSKVAETGRFVGLWEEEEALWNVENTKLGKERQKFFKGLLRNSI